MRDLQRIVWSDMWAAGVRYVWSLCCRAKTPPGPLGRASRSTSMKGQLNCSLHVPQNAPQNAPQNVPQTVPQINPPRRLPQTGLAAQALCIWAAFFLFSTSPVSAQSFTYQGINYVSFQSDEYLKPASEAALDDLHDTGANWVGLLVTWYQPDSTSSTFAPNSLTPTDEALIKAIGDIHQRGLKVMLKPHIDSDIGAWRGTFMPSDTATWFATYESFINHYAALAEAQGVEMFCVGTELRLLTGNAFRTQWESIIAGVRARFSGLLTYSAIAFSQNDEYNTLAFWDLLDLIGVNAYFQLTTKANPTQQELINAWRNNRNNVDLVQAVRDLYEQVNQGAVAGSEKPVIFTEVGYQSSDKTNTFPPFAPTSTLDLKEQEQCYRAVMQVWAEHSDWMQGLFWWGWEAVEIPATDTHFSARGKPAADVLRAFFASGSSPSIDRAEATPLLADVGAIVNFSGNGSDPDGDALLFIWNFGDGTRSAGTVATHGYAARGLYVASLTAYDAHGNSARSVVEIIVVQSTAEDMDGDGFPNELEEALGFSSVDPAATPFGGTTISSTQVLGVEKFKLKLSFRKADAGSVSISGTLPVRAGFAPEGEKVDLFVGGYAESFILSKKGKAATETGRFKMRIRRRRGEVIAQESVFKARYRKVTLGDALEDEGLTGTQSVKDALRVLEVIVLFDGQLFRSQLQLEYTAKEGMKGKGRL